MNCLKCGREVVEQAKFCSYCGERITVECPSCGVTNPSDGLYCLDCGRSLTGGQEPPPEPALRNYGQSWSSSRGCPRCQAVNEPESTYCYKCGLPLEEEPEPNYSPVGQKSPDVHAYQSPRTRANWTVALLVATCIAYTVLMMTTFGVLELVSQQEAGLFVLPAELDEAVQGLDGVSILFFFVTVPTVVLFLMWTHRASRNLRPLGSHGQRFSPGWAVGWWFIPIMFFFRPYQVMAELWRGSNPDVYPEGGVDWKEGSVSALLAWWWGLWITSGLVGYVGFGLGIDRVFDPDAILSSTALQWDLFSSALAIPAGVLAILVVLQITRRQEEKHKKLMAG